MELKEGMYVRTKYGIFKIRKITKDLAYWKHEKRVLELDCNIPEYNYRFSFYKDESIFKGAKFKDKIIDLIEVGDYVNGYKVYSGGKNHFDYILTWDDVENYYMKIPLLSVDIKSIVTKEMFANAEYKVETN